MRPISAEAKTNSLNRRKSYETKQQQVEQARLQYEQALPALLQTLNEQQQGEFADIKTMADVTKLAREDWPRYALWDAQQKKIAAVQQEVTASQERQQQEFTQKWNEYVVKEDAKFIEEHPEMATDKGKELATVTIDLLTECWLQQGRPFKAMDRAIKSSDARPPCSRYSSEGS